MCKAAARQCEGRGGGRVGRRVRGGKREGTMSGNAHFLGTQAVPSARPCLLWLLLAHVLHILAPRPSLHYTTSLTTPLSFSFPSPLVSPSPAPSPPAAMCQIFVAPQARPHSVPASDFAFASLCYFFRILFAVFFFSCLPAFPFPALHTCISLAAVEGLPPPRGCRGRSFFICLLCSFQ